MNKLLMTDIRTLLTAYKENVVTPQEVFESCIKQIERTNKFNAYVKVANSSTNNNFNQKKSRGALEGVPVAVKDNFCTKMFKTTCSSKMLNNFQPSYNATVVDKLIESGCKIIGKTNLDEFAMGSGTVNSIHGPTKNIWGYKSEEEFHICGGSSGGSATAVLSGTCFAALGSDSGGSVRNPAAYCGLVGLKPTYGLISRYGLIPLVHSMDCVGILTRSVNDCVKILETLAGPDKKDSTCLKRRPQNLFLKTKNSLKNLKIGIPIEYYSEFLTEEILNVWKLVADILEDSGATIKEVSMPYTKYSIVCYSILNQCEVSSNMACYDGIEFGYREPNVDESFTKLLAASRSYGFGDVVKARIIAGNYFLLQRNYEQFFDKALRVRRLIANDFDNVFENVDILLTPTTLSTAPNYIDFISKTNHEQCSVQDFCTQPANMAGVPAISIPITLSQNSLPISLQLIGRNLDENLLLRVAEHIENIVKFKQNYRLLNIFE